MADHAEVEYGAAAGNDYEAHVQMYLTFLSMIKWIVATIAVILILMAYFLT
jgi:hypothetical protein